MKTYRTANPGEPYALGTTGPPRVGCYLKAAALPGRPGTAQYLKCTQSLLLDPGIDTHDANNGQFDRRATTLTP